ncbi:MAG: hypothetical protein HYZ45_09290 [Burkholderiales bacterium]|nr:hypothetical protein [Burkholderiales bacterium]
MKSVSTSSKHNGAPQQSRILHLPPRPPSHHQHEAGQEHTQNKRYLTVSAQHTNGWVEDAPPSDSTQQAQTVIKVSVKKSRRAIGKA